MQKFKDIEIMPELVQMVKENKNLKVVNQSYGSPRISSEIMDCSMPLTFDSYNFCSLSCLFCFAYFFKCNNPAIDKIELKSINVESLKLAMLGKGKNERDKELYKNFFSKKFLLHWGGLADPFCNFERKNKVGLELIKFLGEQNYPTLFSFKGNTIFDDEYLKVFEKYSKQKNFAFQTSIITRDDELSRKFEVGVPSPTERIKALKILSDFGYWTILRMRPFIVGITDLSLDSLMSDCLKAGIKGISTEFFALDVKMNTSMRNRYKIIGDLVGCKDLTKYFTKLSPHERGGYQRLNRNLKERFVKKIFKFCSENKLVLGISDPDFKELCTSGSCCAMPDNYPPNRLLENWTRNQLTYHVKEARKLYHKEGKIKKFYFDEIYPESSDYLNNKSFANDHCGTIAVSTTDVQNLTLKLLIQNIWNNLRSPANPRNYFHGKLMPEDIDKKGNLIFKYNPSEYEERWKKEGIDLTY